MALGLELLPFLLGGGSLGGKESCLLACAGLHGASLGLASGGGIRVELGEGLDAAEGVLLAEVLLVGALGGVDNGLNLVGVDDTGKVGIDHGGGGDVLAIVTVDGVKGLEGGLRPDAETTHVAAGGELEEVEAADIAELNTGKIAEGLLDSVVGRVDDKGTATEGVATVTHFSLSGADGLGIGGLVDIADGADGGKDVLGSRGLQGRLDAILEDKGNLGDLIDAVATGHDEGRDGGSGEGRGDRVALLRGVHLLVPLAVGLGGGEHAAATAHVTEGTLPGAAGSAATDAGNTSDGTAGTPGVGGDVLSGADGDGVGLTVVLADVGVDELNNVGTEGGRHDGGKGGLTGLIAGEAEDGNEGTGSHGWVSRGVVCS